VKGREPTRKKREKEEKGKKREKAEKKGKKGYLITSTRKTLYKILAIMYMTMAHNAGTAEIYGKLPSQLICR
jgi:hypothetical protein